ncbi:Arc type transcriptional repressor [Acetobacter phage phiAX1]|nr:Arc type transcriptional repressor [Acetobacter phage phiAX1]
MSRQDPQIHIRLEPSVKDFLQRRAKQQERTMGAHISFLLRQEMKTEKASDQPGSNPDASTTTV